MKTFIKMMMVFWVLGIIYPQISKTNISYHNLITSAPSSMDDIRLMSETNQEMNTLDYIEILDELLGLENISEHSKIKSLKEAWRLGQLKNLNVIKDDCLEFSETALILKCMEMEIRKIKRADLLSIPGNVSDMVLGACLKMETYNDEKICYESLIHKFLT